VSSDGLRGVKSVGCFEHVYLSNKLLLRSRNS
jgi:hypothetical protein